MFECSCLHSLVTEQTKLQYIVADALTDILNAFFASENAGKLRAARESAGNDMLKMMQTVFPIATQIQMNVITKYGFTCDGDGKVCS
jgi:Protein C10